MKRDLVAVVFGVSLSACQPAAQPVAEAPVAPAPTGPVDDAPTGPAESSWEVTLDPVLTLATADRGLTLTCEEAKKTLRLSFVPAWEKDGPFDKATVFFGDKSFPVTIDVSAQEDPLDKYRPVYVLPADADTVTAVMLGTNIRLVVTNQDGEQERVGEPADNGSFDIFGTTCAQINGLR